MRRILSGIATLRHIAAQAIEHLFVIVGGIPAEHLIGSNREWRRMHDENGRIAKHNQEMAYRQYRDSQRD